MSSELTPQQLTILRRNVCPEASDDHLHYFKEVCDSKGLSPFAGHILLQIRNVKNKITGAWDKKASILTTIDGARYMAERTGEYAGSDEPEYDDDDAKAPKWCRVSVYRHGRDGNRIPYTAKLRFDEFKPAGTNGQDRMWVKMPFHMLGKVTEMASLRKAFPAGLAGVYEEDEPIEDGGSPAVMETKKVEKKTVEKKAPKKKEEKKEEPVTKEEVKEKPEKKPEPAAGGDIKWQKTKAAFALHGVQEFEILEKIGDKKIVDINSSDYDMLKKWYLELQKCHRDKQKEEAKDG